jgi:putative transposase
MLRTSTGPRLAVPDALTIAMGEIAGDMCEGLLALAVGAGVSVGRSHGGRRVGVQRPRMCSADGGGEVPVPAYELFSQSQILGRRRWERCPAACRVTVCRVGLEPVGEKVAMSRDSDEQVRGLAGPVAITSTFPWRFWDGRTVGWSARCAPSSACCVLSWP